MAADRRFPRWAGYAGVGFELVGAIAGFGLVGYWVDRHFETGPWGLLVALILGIVGGMYNLVKEALQATRDAARDDSTGRDA